MYYGFLINVINFFVGHSQIIHVIRLILSDNNNNNNNNNKYKAVSVYLAWKYILLRGMRLFPWAYIRK